MAEVVTTPICSGLEQYPRLDEIMLELCFFLPAHDHTCRADGMHLNMSLVELQVQCESLAHKGGSMQVKLKHQGCRSRGDSTVPTPDQQL